MKSIKINSIYNEIFDTYPKVEIEEHIKKLIELDYFYPYNSTFYCITNTVHQNFEYVSKNFTSCTGLSKEKMMAGGMDYFWSLFHPEDINLWLKSLTNLMTFTMTELNDKQRKRMSYTWNYRIKNAKGNYINIIQNTTPLQFDEANKPIIGMAHYTVLDCDTQMDICATAKYLNHKNEYETLYYQNISSSKLLNLISNRERDIIRLIITKNTSEAIANKLNISIHTVNTHRRNILKKINIDSTFELISYFKNNPKLI
ncbi:LuxR family transcriptional regulator [Polaribacter reichenbachii]|uniref:Helix-turn-helix transcriptional regulator n=1 Tax=Polaribacter reichenbachii TaxID=996801 RepID=A0A1B8U4Y4_9FLAO|nr:LuxR C-terminal-related transcriptional regulator [Polaribacter reichenbachii]APZ47972.1 LuxR family transcriptional regulator [Polaribacter reichenbachii]AUC18606.1 LuxR family transcriptional regulator [Polaribacter reichenbachii]OBY66901.1 helix-turn-helix transcriptional regulator [Polaribacter reichenbachii]